jgi:flagellar hook-associated protein 1 FlgK
VPYAIFEIAKNTLLAQQVAMQVVGHNIANAHTDGYVRQVPVMQALHGALGDGNLQSVGHGVAVGAVVRLQSAFANIQLTRQMALMGEAGVSEEMLTQVEAIFTEFTETGIMDNMSQMFTAFASIGTDPTSLAPRYEVVIRATLMADTIAGRQANLQSIRTEIDNRMAETVREANRLATQIAELNCKITEAANDTTVNDLKSSREAAMKSLAKLTGAYFIEQPSGQIDVMIGGDRMVQGAYVTELSLQIDPANPGMRKICLGTEKDPDGIGGELAGLRTVRDESIPAYMAKLDTFAQTLADAVNAIHATGFDLNGDAGGQFFIYDASCPALSLTVNPAIEADPQLVAASSWADAPGDGSVASQISYLRDTKIFLGGLLSPSEYYADLMGQLGSDAKAAADAFAAREAVVESLKVDYEARSGVSLDEEATELLRYQQVYNAAAHLMQISEEMMDALFAIV